MVRTKFFFILLSMVFCTACASGIVGDPDKPISIINVVQEGKYNHGRPGMAEVCKGFYLSVQEVNEFYTNSELVSDIENKEVYKILPCYTQGTAAIRGKLYKWTIRAGGIGEFYNDNDHFVKVCGKKCCQKLSGIC